MRPTRCHKRVLTAAEVLAVGVAVAVVINPITARLIGDLAHTGAHGDSGVPQAVAVGAIYASVAVVVDPIGARLIGALKHRGVEGGRGGARLYTVSGLSTVRVITVG